MHVKAVKCRSEYHMPFRTNSTMVGFGNWDTDNDIFVFKRAYDITHNKYNVKPDETTSGELLLKSTFAGGGGPNSYRFKKLSMWMPFPLRRHM